MIPNSGDHKAEVDALHEIIMELDHTVEELSFVLEYLFRYPELVQRYKNFGAFVASKDYRKLVDEVKKKKN